MTCPAGPLGATPYDRTTVQHVTCMSVVAVACDVTVTGALPDDEDGQEAGWWLLASVHVVVCSVAHPSSSADVLPAPIVSHPLAAGV